MGIVLALALGFGLANGVHDAGNAIAAPIVTRALRPGPAIALAAVFHVLGALVAGRAVAATVAGVVNVPGSALLEVAASALLGALAWNLLTLRLGMPCSSGHSLVGALAGAALADSGLHAVVWGGLHGIRPVGVLGVLVWLFASAVVAVPLAAASIRLAHRGLRRASRAVLRPVRRAELVTSAALAFAHGSNDAQKTMGLMTIALVAGGRLRDFVVPLWVACAAAAALTLGTSLGGWRVVRTLGGRIYPLRALDGFASQAAAAAIVLTASLAGAPISTTDVVAPAVVGVGAGERWRHVRWAVVGEIGLSFLVTLPASAALGALVLAVWRAA